MLDNSLLDGDITMTEVGKSTPEGSDLYINEPLTEFAIAWKTESKRYVAGMAFPEVGVDLPTGEYHVWERADFFRDDAIEMGPKSQTPMMDLSKTTDTYAIKVWGIGGMVTEQDMASDRQMARKKENITRAAINKLLLKREKQWIAAFFTTGIWKGSTTGNDLVGGVDFVQFSNLLGSDPILVIRPQVFHMAKLGVDPLDLVLTVGPIVWQWIVDHPDFLERYENVMPAVINEELVAKVLGIREVRVAYASETTSAPKVADASTTMDFVFGKHMLLSYSPRAPSLDEPSAGYMINWTGLIPDGGDDGVRIREVPIADPFGVKIIGNIAFTPKLTCSVCGVFFANAVA